MQPCLRRTRDKIEEEQSPSWKRPFQRPMWGNGFALPGASLQAASRRWWHDHGLPHELLASAATAHLWCCQCLQPGPQAIDDLQNYCLGTRRGIAADRGRPAVGFVYISNEKLVHFIFSLWPFSSENHAPKGPERKRNKPRCWCWPAIFASILFSENEKGQMLHGRRRAIVHAMHCSCVITNYDPCLTCQLLPYLTYGKPPFFMKANPSCTTDSSMCGP